MATWSTWNGNEQYVWVVICKNHKYHDKQNMFSGHKIPLGETDQYAPPSAAMNAARNTNTIRRT